MKVVPSHFYENLSILVSLTDCNVMLNPDRKTGKRKNGVGDQEDAISDMSPAVCDNLKQLKQ